MNTRRDREMNGKMHTVGCKIRGGGWVMELLFMFVSLLVLCDFSELHACITLQK